MKFTVIEIYERYRLNYYNYNCKIIGNVSSFDKI